MLASLAMNGEKPPVRGTMQFLMLPNDLVLNCLARVSRLYYPTLSLVCKRFQSLVASLELYETRTLLGCTESCLYVCLWRWGDSKSKPWYTLCQRPTQIYDPNPNLKLSTPCFWKLDKSIDDTLVSFSALNMLWSNLIALGCNIYIFGGECGNSPFSKSVWSMDCRSHTWRKAPSLELGRVYPSINVLDGKIYVAGGNDNDFSSSNWIESFDPNTQIWEHVPSPDIEIIRGTNIKQSLVIDGKLYFLMRNGKCVIVYNPRENGWNKVGSREVPWDWDSERSCVIDNVLYSYKWKDTIQWYDFEARYWRVLKGLEKLYELSKTFDRLVDYGGNIAVFWEQNVGEKKIIWCAEIALERRNKHEIVGNVEWSSVVLVVPKSCYLFKVRVVTI